MHILEQKSTKLRLAYALKCKPEEVPSDPDELRKALGKRIADMREVKRGKSVHQSL